jgi:HSP20 family molecular chaperone IbpA
MSEKLPFLALMRGLGNVLERLVDSANAQSERETQSERGPQSEQAPQIVSKRGFSIRGLDGSGLDDLKELAERLKNQAAAPIPQKRTLQLEVHAESKQIVVIIHEPTLQAECLQVHIDGDMLELSAEQANGLFHGEALLPSAVKASSQVLSTHAGMIELRWQKQRRAARKPSGTD